MRMALREQADALDAVLARRGYSAIGACPLFRLIETDDAAALFERLARHSILTRPFDYDPRWLRLGLPADRQALDRLDAALADD
jgi:cobalamin biosynthetic protein CobC